jgi:hypothetical protein
MRSPVLVRVELLADRVDLDQRVLLEGGNQLLQRQLDAGAEGFDRLLLDGQRGLQAVLDGEQFAGELLDGKLVRRGDVFLRAAADVLAVGLGAQPGVVVFGGLQFEAAQLLLEAGQRVDDVLAGFRRTAVRVAGFVAQVMASWTFS